MNRREARELVLHLIFSGEYTGNKGEELLKDINEENFRSLESEYELYQKMPQENQEEYIRRAVTGVMEHLYELDNYIEKYAKGWNIARISRISKCILRLSMFEVLYLGIPVGASVNEALELAKNYDSEEAAGFVNGIMGAFVEHEVQA
jgi:N utilization substance protein B